MRLFRYEHTASGAEIRLPCNFDKARETVATRQGMDPSRGAVEGYEAPSWYKRPADREAGAWTFKGVVEGTPAADVLGMIPKGAPTVRVAPAASTKAPTSDKAGDILPAHMDVQGDPDADPADADAGK